MITELGFDQRGRALELPFPLERLEELEYELLGEDE
jgi:hypothetical protein